VKMETQIYNYDLRFSHKLNEKNVEVLEIKKCKRRVYLSFGKNNMKKMSIIANVFTKIE